MNWLHEAARRFTMLMHRRQFDADLEEEMQLHLELRQKEHLDSGMTADSARAAARRAPPAGRASPATRPGRPRARWS